MQRKNINLIASLSVILVGGISLFAGSASANDWQQVKTRNFPATEYRLKPSSNNQFVWDWQHSKVNSNLKDYPNSTWYIDQSITLKYKGRSSVYYVISNKHNDVKEGGLIWRGYLTRQGHTSNTNPSKNQTNTSNNTSNNDSSNSNTNSANNTSDEGRFNSAKSSLEKAIKVAQIPNRHVNKETNYQSSVMKDFSTAYDSIERIQNSRTKSEARNYLVNESSKLFLKTNERGNFTYEGQNYYENYSPLSRIPKTWNQLNKYMY